jgi:hypothetical protein
MNSLIKCIPLTILWLFLTDVSAQQLANITGRITDENKLPLVSAAVGIPQTTIGTITDQNGEFVLKVPANQPFTILISFQGYASYQEQLNLKTGQSHSIIVSLEPEVEQLNDVEIFGVGQRENSLIPINIKDISQLPNSSGNIETILKTLPGVASGNELSSQYSVRGGSFDENLIYVNDVEVYRPLLVQSAQQEGLSFVNPSMVSSIQFSAGGFDAEYGDKLSSVLDIRYKKPTMYTGSASASFLGGSAHLEGVSKSKRFTHITGLRYKTTRLLLGTLNTKGDYNPSFTDLQTFLTYDLSRSWEITFLGNMASNRFYRKPTVGNVVYGPIQSTLNFQVYYEGEELDKFDSYMGALSINFHPNDKLLLKFIGSGFQSDEKVTYDLLKQYWIGLATQGSSGRRDSLVNIGVGSLLDHARDYLKSYIYSIEHKGVFFTDIGILKWGIKAQAEYVNDKVNEWRYLDSADYSLPYSDEVIDLEHSYKSANTMNNSRYAAFIQQTFNFNSDAGKISLTLGVRSQVWSYNKQVTVSPRGNIVFIPANRPNSSWHLSTGLYHQPPFYKELRDETGQLYPGKKAQQAFHLVFGNDLNFLLWRRPFVLSSEIFYKNLTHVIPYKLDDVRLQYLPMYEAKAYAGGADVRIFGEFVPGYESWFSISFLQTREDIYNDYIVKTDGEIVYPGYYPRPTDQWINFSLFFQDFLPSNPNYKVHLMLVYGSGLNYSGPFYNRPSETYALGPYRRVDVGFSRLITRNGQKKMGIKSIWISAEILNLLGAENRVSLDWIRTVESQMGVDAYFAVPNNLTGRLFNLKISVNY